MLIMEDMEDRSNWPSGVTTLAGHDNHIGLENTTVDERVAMMWQIAVDAWTAMGKKHLVEQGFQRHLGGVQRGKR